MTEKRFTYIKNSSISQYQSIPIQKIGKGKAFHCQGLVDELNKLWNENEQLKQELQRIYDVATLKKARDIVDKVYDDLLYETSEKSDYARNKVLECLEKLDEFGDDLE